MNSTVDEITQSSGKFSLFDCTTDDLKQLVNQYPFFAPAKFLLAKKMKENNSFLFEEQIQKVSIYFQNPVWLDHVLNDAAKQEEYEAPATVIAGTPNDIAASANVITSDADVITSDTDVITSGANFVASEANVIASEAKQQEAALELTTDTETPPTTETSAPTTEMEEPPTYEGVVDQTTPDPDDVVNEDQPEPGQPQLTVELPKFNFEPVDPSKASLSFEPYHTIDYFASQGIKAKDENGDKPKDRLTRQLKSFTEWIKTMKRLPDSEITANVSVTDEKKVEKMAEVSIHDREVVTEAMAEVWEKQGNKAKATEIYQKLSLLNPGKSSYFAAKIEQLKHL